jgi:hypothetical protein
MPQKTRNCPMSHATDMVEKAGDRHVQKKFSSSRKFETHATMVK